MDWKKIDVIGPVCEINREGVVRQKVKKVMGGREYNVERKAYHGHRGRLYMTFRDEGKQQLKYIHVLVAEAFVSNPLKHKHVIAIDGDYLNVNAENLYWASKEDPSYKKESGSAKLSETDVEEIKELLEEGTFKQCEIARRFNISESRISRIKASMCL